MEILEKKKTKNTTKMTKEYLETNLALIKFFLIILIHFIMKQCSIHRNKFSTIQGH